MSLELDALNDRGTDLGGIARYAIRNRHLILEMAKRDIQERYSGRLFGALWALFSPIALMIIYVAVFTFLYSVRLSAVGHFRGDYTALLLSGLVPWLVIQETLSRCASCLIAQPSLVRQIAFPTGTLPIKTVLGSAPLALATSVFLLGYQFVVGPWPPWTAFGLLLYWPLFFLFALGLGLWLCALAVFFRDIQEVLALVFAGGLFLGPILFIPGLTPSWLERAFYFNPFSYPIWVHKDLVFYGAIAHPLAWIVFPVLAIFLFVSGAIFFRRVEGRFGDAL
jgi:lipopolysaccharide transport system permease protein